MNAPSPLSSDESVQKEVRPAEHVLPNHPQAISSPVQHAIEFQEGAPPQVVDPNTAPKNKTSVVALAARWKICIVVGVLVILAVIGIALGVVLGRGSSGRDNNISASDDGGGSPHPEGTKAATDPTRTTEPSSTETSDSKPTGTSEPTASDGILEPSGVPKELKMGVKYSSSFTFYGSNDGDASSNCSRTPDIGCGFYSRPGFTAGISQNLYGTDTGVGDACGTCWRLEAETDSSGGNLGTSITVVVNDLCMAEGYPVCGQKSVDDVNEYDAQVNFNLCFDSGAADELFDGDLDLGVAIGTATRVDCDEWEGKAAE